MTFVWLTDTHLDFAKRNAVWRLGRKLVKTKADGVLITGDIATSDTLRVKIGNLRWPLGIPNLPIYFVLGNHDFWGSGFAAMREQTAAWADRAPNLYLGAEEDRAVELGDGVFLVGVDGWYDGRLGNLDTSTLRMWDWWQIRELQWMVAGSLAAPTIRRMVFAQLGDQSAEAADRRIRAAISVGARHVLVLTHVPPFRNAALHKGAPSDDESAPYYVNATLGLTLLAVAADHPGVRITVLCGHSHSRATSTPAPNLVVHTGAAEYGKRTIAGMVHTSPTGVRVIHRM